MKKETKREIGILIGRNRKYLFKHKSCNFNQKQFTIYKDYPICSQSTLSRIENGFDFSYEEVIEVLINKLGYSYSNNQEDYIELFKLADIYVELLVYNDNNQLLLFEKKVETFYHKHKYKFYISQSLEILRYSLKYYLHSELPNIDKIEEMIFYFPNQSNLFNLILKDIIVWFLEISPFKSDSIGKYLLINPKLDDSNILNVILNTNISIRNGDLIKAIRLLDKIKDIGTNSLMRFRINRLYLLIHINILKTYDDFKVDYLDFEFSSDNIPKFELAKLYHLLGIVNLYKKNYVEALENFNLSHSIYESICVISMQFMVEIYRKSNSFDIQLFMQKANMHINNYPKYYKNQFRLFEIIYIEKDYPKGIKFLEKNLAIDLKSIKLRNLQFSIFESQLIELVSRTNSYKSIYDFYIITQDS